MAFKAPFLRYDDLRKHAEAFLQMYHPTRTIPVPIEYIVDLCLEMDVVPVPGLQANYDTVSYLTRDLKEIRVDEYVYQKRPSRYRFSLAHEVGHRVLHADVYRQLRFSTIAEWKRVITTEIPEDQYTFLEFHAYSFAGLVLVPRDSLKMAFFDYVEVAQAHGIDFDQPETGVREEAEAHIAKLFEVSPDVVHRRIEFDKLWHE